MMEAINFLKFKPKRTGLDKFKIVVLKIRTTINFFRGVKSYMIDKRTIIKRNFYSLFTIITPVMVKMMEKYVTIPFL